MKKFLLPILFVCALILVSCGSGTPGDIDCAAAVDKLAPELGRDVSDFDRYTMSSEPLDVAYFYGSAVEAPDFSHVTDYCVLVPNVTAADEMGIFRIDDAGAAEQIKAYLANRTSARATTFAPYDEVESRKAADAAVDSCGNYVWYVIAADSRRISGEITSMIMK